MATAHDHADEILANIQTYTEELQDLTNDFAKDAATTAQNFVTLNDVPFNFESTAFEDLTITEPGLFQDGFNLPVDDLEAPDFQDIFIPDLQDIPDPPEELDTSNLFRQTTPVFDITGLTETPPDIGTDVELPDTPEITEHQIPERLDEERYRAPRVAVPTFDEEFAGQRPDSQVDLNCDYQAAYDKFAPEMRDFVDSVARGWIDTYAPEYDAQMAKLEAKICEQIDGRTTAIDDDVEQRIFDRARTRAEDERIRLDSELVESYARRGYELPPGALFSGLHENQLNTAKNISAAASEVAIERARLEQQHYQFVMQLTAGIRDSIRAQSISYVGQLVQVNGQALEYAKETVSLVIEQFNQAVRLYEVDATVFRTQAQVYETRLESAFAELRSFQAEMEAIRTRTDVEQLEVNRYNSLIAAEQNKIELYLAQLRGVTETLNQRRLAVDIFEAQVRGYLATVQAKEAEFGAYRAALQGDTERVRAYGEEVSAYRARVDALRSITDAQRVRADLTIANNRNLTQIFETQVRKYEAELRAEGQRFSTSAEAYRAGLDRYRTVLQQRIEKLRTQYEAERINLEGQLQGHRTKAELTIEQGRLWQNRNNRITEILQSLTNLYGQMAQASLSQQNSIVNIVSEGENA